MTTIHSRITERGANLKRCLPCGTPLNMWSNSNWTVRSFPWAQPSLI